MRRLHLPAVTAIVGIVVLAGCAAQTEPAVAPSVPTPTPTSEPEPLPLGSPALPLGCADLVDIEMIETMAAAGEPAVVAVVDEHRLERDIRHIAAVQAGVLHCVWSSSFGSTGFARTVTIDVGPSASLKLDAASVTDEDAGGRTWSDFPLAEPTVVTCSDIGYISDTDRAGSCAFVALRDGYRIRVEADGLPDIGDGVQGRALAMLERVELAVRSAGEGRRLSEPVSAGVPARHCDARGVREIVAGRGGAGEPAVAPSDGLTTCVWTVPDPWTGLPAPLTVSVLPAGAWAFGALATGVDHFPMMYVPSPSGRHLVSAGDSFAVLAVVGGDLVAIETPGATEDGEAARWAALVDANL